MVMDTRRSQQYSLLPKQERSSEDDTSISDEGDSLSGVAGYKQPSRLRRIVKSCIIQLGILTVYTILLVPLIATVLPTISPIVWKQEQFFSPMQDAMKYKPREVGYNFEDINPFKGQSLEQIEKSWDGLINNPHDMALPAQDIQKMNRTSIEFVAGPLSGKVLAQPLTYHMLHCLYNIYKYNHPDFYGPDPAGPEWIVTHTDHCIDNLRQFVQCHASTGVSTFKWLPDRKIPYPVLNAEEICVDWDHYDGWIQEQAMPMQQERTLLTQDGESFFVHPTLGALSAEDYRKASEKAHGPHSHGLQ